MSRIRTAFEKWVFAINQVSRIANLIFFLLLLAGTFYEYFQWHLYTYLGIHPIEHFKGIAVLFLILLIITTVVGMVFVHVLKMWRYQLFVSAVKNNQYSKDTFVPKEIGIANNVLLPIAEYIKTGDKKHIDKTISTLKQIRDTGKIEYTEDLKKFERVIK